MKFLFKFVFIVLMVVSCKSFGVIYAVNCGGGAHKDVNGITYMADPSKVGFSSDYGKNFFIKRIDDNDKILYQTERYSTSAFGYDIPIIEDGKYVFVLKFSEVYFRYSDGKVFDVVLNNHHKIVDSLDIYNEVGFATAHDEIIPFTVSDSGRTLTVRKDTSDIMQGKIRLEFVPGAADNPKINAFYVAKGAYNDVPLLPELEEDYIEEEEEEANDMLYGMDEDDDIYFRKKDLGKDSGDVHIFKKSRFNVRSGLLVKNPWDQEPVSVVCAPIGVALLAGLLGYFLVETF